MPASKNHDWAKVSQIEIENNDVDQRIDNYLVSLLPGLPRTRLYRLIRKGEIRVNKKRVKPSYRLQVGDVLRIAPIKLEKKSPKWVPEAVVAQLKTSLLYEDQDVMVLNKPVGIPVHGGTNIAYGIIDGLRKIYPDIAFLQLAHRLDRGTSGCLILCKSKSALREIHQGMLAGTVNKSYLVLVHGKWPINKHEINLPLQKSELMSGERMVVVSEDGKSALSYFSPIETFNDHTLLEVTIATGRTHQIRVHASYHGHPVVGDSKYGGAIEKQRQDNMTRNRMFLHANSLKFSLNSWPKAKHFVAPMDEEFTQALKLLEEKR